MPAPGNQRARAEGIRFVRALRPTADALVIAGRSGTGKTHLAIAITASVVRAGARGRYFHTVDLVSRLD